MNEGEGPYLYSAIPALEFELSAPAALLLEKVSHQCQLGAIAWRNQSSIGIRTWDSPKTAHHIICQWLIIKPSTIFDPMPGFAV